MALDPKMLASLPDTLVDLYGVVEIDILRDMARRISTYDYFIPAALHQNQKLQELGMVQSEIITRLSALTGQTQEELIALLSEASAEAVEDDIDYYTRADVYEPSKVDTEALYAQLNSGLLQTEQAFFNITRTTANTATKQFERALDRAWLQINSGAFDYNTAIKNAVQDLAETGLGAIEYPSGRIDSIEVAVRRAVVTGANQTALKTQEVLADELEIDLVEVSAHGGARPEHAKWQGKVFSRNGRVTIDGVTYEDLRKGTGYGTGAGLGGWNCRHTFFPYVPGASRSWTDKELKALEEKRITYNGEKYTEYEASQIQRGIERDIRKLKRTVEAIEAVGGDASAERTKLRKAQKRYTDFSEQTGMKKQSARTMIASKKAEREAKKAYDSAGILLTNNGNSNIITNTPAAAAPNLVINGKRAGTAFEVVEAAKGTNPNYNKDRAYRINCQRCVQAFEYRRRGFDVEALPKKGRGDRIAWGNECFVDANGNVPQFEYFKTRKEVEKELNAAPDGARYIIYVKWKGRNAGAHVFIAEKEQGKMRFVDPQNGDTDVTRYFSDGSAGNFGFLRVDDKELTTDIAIINETMR